MPNLKDEKPINSFLLVGPAGSGKTFQFKTLPGGPGEKYAWIFDPNAKASLAGQDIEYFDGVADVSGKGLAKAGSVAELVKAGAALSTDIYKRFWDDIRSKIISGYFDQIKSFLFDGITGWGAIVEEKVLADLNKPAGELEKREFNQFHREMAKALHQVASLIDGNGKSLLVTAHRRATMDQAGTKLIAADIATIGQSRISIPIHFANILFTVSEGDSKGVQYYAYTRRTDVMGDARVSNALSGLPVKIDLTVKDLNRPQDFGLGKLICESNGGK